MTRQSSSRPIPRPYQEAALNSLQELRRNGVGRALVILASGLGKTFVSAFDAYRFAAGTRGKTRILYLSHRYVILQQAEDTFRKVFGTSMTYGRFDGEVHDSKADMIFGMFDSVYKHLTAFDPRQFDYLVVDEAHHTAAPTRDAVVSFFNPRFTIGLTATPLRGDGIDVGSYYGDVVASNLPLERALVEGLLTPIDYRVVSDNVDKHKLLRLLRSAKVSESLFRPRVDREVVHTIMDEVKKLNGNHKVIVFCSRIPEMNRFASLIPHARTISGENSREEQISIVKAFADGEFSVLLAVDVLNEGIDVPEVNMLVFLRNTESSVVFLQQLGRGLRKTDKKRKVKVLDFVNNVDRFYFVYAFFNRLRAEEASARSRGVFAEESSSILHLDQTARDVINLLLQRRETAGQIVDLAALGRSFDNALHPRTLMKIVRHGRLVPDFTIEGPPAKYYFERTTYERFLRQVYSPHYLRGLITDRMFARAIKRSVAWLRDKERQGTFSPSWIHKRAASQKWEFYYDELDLAEAQTMDELRDQARTPLRPT